MNRRDTVLALLAFGAAIAPLPFVRDALAQTPYKVYRLAYLDFLRPDPAGANLASSFEKGLKELGYVEGQNLVIDRRYAVADRFPVLAAELVRNKPDVIFAPSTPGAQAAKAASGTIPIVIALASDPVGSGFAASLAKPGGNITGTSNIQTDIDPKRLQILKELIPSLKRVALMHAGDRLAHIQNDAAQRAGKLLGIEVLSLDARQAADYKKGFAALTARGVGAIMVAENGQNSVNAGLILELTAKYKLPAIYSSPQFADRGGLITYGTDPARLYHRAAAFVDKILKGATPSDLPIEQPTTFELVINLKTARALGITIPQSLLVRADRVIE